MFNRYSFGATVTGIFLLVVFGILRAFNWLSESSGTDSFVDRSEFVEVDTNEGPRNAIDGSIEGTHVPDARNDDHALTFADDQVTSSSDNRFLEDVLDPTPLEAAGTYIQRQNGAQLDPLVADSQVEATSLGTDQAISAQDDTQSDQLVSPYLSDPSPMTTDAGNIGSTAPDSQSVPALW